jgi:hypothetical protein
LCYFSKLSCAAGDQPSLIALLRLKLIVVSQLSLSSCFNGLFLIIAAAFEVLAWFVPSLLSLTSCFNDVLLVIPAALKDLTWVVPSLFLFSPAL